MKHLSIDEVYESLETRALAKVEAGTKLSVIWEKVRPFLVMLAGIFRKIKPWVNAFIAAIDNYVDSQDPEV